LQGVTIYTLDSGIDLDHQEFQGLDGGPSRASYGWSFVDGDDQARDVDGHGARGSSPFLP
jgi:subtilisin family serine protease